jgi:hypothetical protein
MKAILAALALIGTTMVAAATPVCGASYASCCKHCSKGKPCGDSCISRDKECHKPKGCACSG